MPRPLSNACAEPCAPSGVALGTVALWYSAPKHPARGTRHDGTLASEEPVIHRIKTIDAHAGGEPLRLVVDGFPSPRGRSMLEKREWVAAHQDHLRRALVLEPRGHTDMYGAILTEAVSPGSHAGVLFMHNEGYSTMCGHGIIAVTTIALERGLLMPGGDGRTVIYDTPAGTVRAMARPRKRGRESFPVPDIAETTPDPFSAARVESVAF